MATTMASEPTSTANDPGVVSSPKKQGAEETSPAADSMSTSSSVTSESDGDTTTNTDTTFPTGLHQRKNKTTTANDSTDKKKERPVQPKNPLTLARWMEIVTGAVIFFTALPFVFYQIVMCNLWEQLDQRIFHMVDLGNYITKLTSPYQTKFVTHPTDTYLVNITAWLTLCLPAYFFYEAYVQAQAVADGVGFIWWRCFVYNIFRIGPMYRNFMYVYAVSHKEAHTYGKIFCAPYHYVLQYAYNYWIGFFHGVLPGVFTQSHIHNHHKYDNGKEDVYSTGAFPRDSFVMYLRYVTVWFEYALNISTVLQFAKESKYKKLFWTVVGTMQYLAGVALAAYLVSPMFALFYIIWPLVEGNSLLAAINYTWHAFIDPEDFDNDYVNSITILEGLNFTLAEEYHVVHHQYAGIHWSRHEEMYKKHYDEYIKRNATVFYKENLFVVWGMIVAADYEGLANIYVQLEPDKSKHLSKPELAQVLKERLQCTTWSY